MACRDESVGIPVLISTFKRDTDKLNELLIRSVDCYNALAFFRQTVGNAPSDVWWADFDKLVQQVTDGTRELSNAASSLNNVIKSLTVKPLTVAQATEIAPYMEKYIITVKSMTGLADLFLEIGKPVST
jgi:hypothetical protein